MGALLAQSYRALARNVEKTLPAPHTNPRRMKVQYPHRNQSLALTQDRPRTAAFSFAVEELKRGVLFFRCWLSKKSSLSPTTACVRSNIPATTTFEPPLMAQHVYTDSPLEVDVSK